MAWGLKEAGTFTVSTAVTSFQATWAAGQAPTAGNLLVVFFQTTNTGWTNTGLQPGWIQGATWNGGLIQCWWKVATSADNSGFAPQWSNTVAGNVYSQFAEYTGGTVSSALDQIGGYSAPTSSPASSTCPAVDYAAGDLVLTYGMSNHSAAETCTSSNTFNMGATATSLYNNDSTSTTQHWRMSYGTTTAKTGPDNCSYADNGMKVTSLNFVMVSFAVSPVTVDQGAIGMSGTAGMTVAGALPISRLSDPFNQTAGVDTTKWTPSDTNVTTAQGPGYPYVLQITCPATTTTYHQLYSTYANYAYNYWNLTNSSVSICCISAGNQALASLEVYPLYLTDESYNTGGKNALFWYINGNTIAAYQWVGGVQTRLASMAYSAYNHSWLRIRESGGTVYFDYSPNGINRWTTLTTTPDIPHINGLGLWVQAGTYNSETTATSCTFANLNLPVALVETWTDNFATAGTPNPALWVPGNWGASTSGTVVNANGSLNLNLAAGAANGSGPNIVDNASGGLNLIGSSCTLQLAGLTAGSSTTNVIQFDFRMYAGGTSLQGGLIVATKAGSPSGLALTVGGVGPNWDPIAMAWLRIRETAGTIYYEYSANGQTWTSFANASTATVFPGNTGQSLNWMLDLVCEGTYIASTALVDNFNLPPTLTAFANGPNLLSVADSEFESALTGDWTGSSATLAQTTAQAHAGYGSLQLTATATGTIMANTTITGIVPNATYTLSFWYRSATTTHNFGINYSWLTSAGVYITGASGGVPVSSNTAWQQQTFSLYNAPVNAAKVQINLEITNVAAVGEVHYFDSIQIYQNAGAITGMTVTPAIGATLNGTTSMTISPKVQEIASLLMSGSTAMNVAGLTVEQGTTNLVGSTGMTIGSRQTIPAAVAMSASSGINVSLSYRADMVATSGMIVVGTQITGRHYSFTPSRIYIGGAAGAIAMVGASGMTVGAIVQEIASVAPMAASAALNLTTVIMIAAQKMAILQDAFNVNGAPDTTKWQTYASTGVTVANSGGNLVISLPAGAPVGNGGQCYSGATSQPNTYYDLTESYAIVRVANAGVQTDSTHQVLLTFMLYDQDNNDFGWAIQNNQIGWLDQTGAWNLRGTYTAATFQWLRIREHAGFTYFDYSADGNIWSNLASVPDTTWIYPPRYLQPTLAFDSQTATALPAQSATFDNFNLPPASQVTQSGTAGMTVAGVTNEQASVSQAATTGMTVAASVKQLAGVSLAGGATLNISTLGQEFGTAPLSGTAGMTVASTGAVTENASIAMAATTSMTVAATRTQFATVPFAGASTMTVGSLVTEVAALSLSGTAGLTVTGGRTQFATVPLAGTAGLTAGAMVQQYAAVTMSGVGGMVASLAGFTTSSFAAVVNGNLNVGTYLVTEVASVAHAGSASLTIAAQVQQNASITQTGVAALAVTGIRIIPSAVTMTDTTTLTATGVETYIFTIGLSGTGTLSVAAITQEVATVAMSGTGGLYASLAAIWWGVVNFTPGTTLTVGSAVTEIASISLNGQTTLNVFGTDVHLGALALSGTAGMTVATSVQENAIVGTNVLRPADSDFETASGFTWGGQNNTVARSTAVPANTGSYCLAITATTTGGGSASSGWTYYGATPGLTYSASMWVLAGATPRQVACEIVFFDASGSTVTGSKTGIGLTDSATWQQVSVSGAVAPANTVYVAIYWRYALGASAVGEIHYVDTVQLLSPYGAIASLTVGGLTVEQASVSLSGTAGMSLAGSVQENASVSLVPVTSLVVAGTAARIAVVALSGASTLTPAAVVTELASVTMAGTAHLSVTPTVYGFVNLSSTASLAFTVAVQEVASFAAQALSSLSVAASGAELATVNLVGTSTFTATALRTLVATVNLLPVSTLSLTNVQVQQNAAVSMVVTSSLVETYQVLGTALLSATAGLTMVARSWSIIQGQVTMTGTAALQVVPEMIGSIGMAALASLRVDAKMIIGVAPGFSATTSMVVDAHAFPSGEVMMSVSAKLVVDADIRRKAPTLFDQIQALEGQDPIMVGATGYMDDIFTTRLVSDSE